MKVLETFLIALLGLVSITIAQVCPRTTSCTTLSVLFDKHVVQSSTNLTQVGEGLCGNDRRYFGHHLKACATQVEQSMHIEAGIVSGPAIDAFNLYCNDGDRHFDLAWYIAAGQALTHEFGLQVTLPNGTLVEPSVQPSGSMAEDVIGTPLALGCFCDGGRCDKLHAIWSGLASGHASEDLIGRRACDSNLMLYYLHECFTCAIQQPPAVPSKDNYTLELSQGTFAEGNILNPYLGFCYGHWSGESNLFNLSQWVSGLSLWSNSLGVVFPNGTRYRPSSTAIAARAIGFSATPLGFTSTTTSFITVDSTTTLDSTFTSTSTVSVSSVTSSTPGASSSLLASSVGTVISATPTLETSSQLLNLSSSISSSNITLLSSSSAPVASISELVIASTSSSTEEATTTTSTVFNTHLTTVILTVYDSTSSSVSSAPSNASMGLVTGTTSSSNDALSGSTSSRLTVTSTRYKSTTTIHVGRVSGSTCDAQGTVTIFVYGTPTAVEHHVPSSTANATLNYAMTGSMPLGTMPVVGLQGTESYSTARFMNGTIAASSTLNPPYQQPTTTPFPLQTGNGAQLGGSTMAAAVLLLFVPYLV